MRSLDEVIDLLAFHPATDETAPRHARLRDVAMAVAQETWDLIPDGPEKTLAFRGLQDFLLHANAAVAQLAPADLGPTRMVARQLPPELRVLATPPSDPG
jgi:hypothetical protein